MAPPSLALRVLLIVVAAAASTACHGNDGKVAPDAGPRDAAPPRVAPIRTAIAGELLADLDESRIKAMVIKDRNAALPVAASIALRDGRLTLAGPTPSAHLSIDLTTFDSSIALRNERVKQFFFETSSVGWDTAELTIATLPASALEALRATRRATHVKLSGTLQIHGRTSAIELLVDAAYDREGTLVVKTAAPVALDIAAYGLDGNLRRLSSICMHDSIDEIVKVEATIAFPTR